MAITVKRWLLYSTLGCLSIAVAYLPPSQYSLRLRSADRQWATSVRQHLVREHEGLRLLLHRDGFYETSGQSLNGVRLHIHDDVPTQWRPLIRETVSRQADLLANIQPEVPIGAIATVDSMPIVEGAPISRVSFNGQLLYLLPVVNENPNCLVVMRLGRRDVGIPRILSPGNTRDILGPCAFYARFGMPGDSVQEWLLEGGHVFASDYLPSNWTFDETESPATPFSLYYYFFLGGLNPFELGCAGGKASACDLAMARISDLYDSGRRGVSRRSPQGFRYREAGFGSRHTHILADLMADRGQDLFQRFWSSPLEVEQAFLSTYGESFGSWMSTWASARFDAPPPGPYPRLVAVFAGLVIAIAALAGSMRYANRRQVS